MQNIYIADINLKSILMFICGNRITKNNVYNKRTYPDFMR